MLIFVAPSGEDPRDGGFNNAIPGELVTRPMIVCDLGRDGACGCERMWRGMTSGKGTSIAEVVERPELEGQAVSGGGNDYVEVVGAHLIEVFGWDEQEAVEEAGMYLGLARHFGAGALVTIDSSGDESTFEKLDAQRP